MYNCSCNQAQAELVDSLPSQMTVTYRDFEQKLTDCLHVKATKIIMAEVDAIYDIHPEREFTGQPFTAPINEPIATMYTAQIIPILEQS